MADTLCPVCRWWYDGNEGHKCRGTEREQHQRALADRDRRIEALTKALRWADDWIGGAPHGDNCYVSNHYEGDPGNQCNCGKESLLEALASAAGADGGQK